MEEVTAPGLKWIKRRASRTPIWVSSVKGYEPKTVNLAHLRDEPEQLVAKCALLQAEMNVWKAGLRERDRTFDGSLKSIIEKYQTEADSPYFALRPKSRKPYDFYLSRLIHEVGDRRIDKITGVDLKRWHDSWSENGKRLAASKMMRAVIDAAVSYGVMCRITPCIELREVLKAASRKLPNPKRREIVITADQVVALRAAAHAAGRPSSALAYALVYETTLRLWDVIGQWVPIDSPGVSDVVNQRTRNKWFGLRWEDIDEAMVLRYVPSKTSMKTGLAVAYPLNKARMVMEELENWQAAKRSGPVIVYEMNGRPYLSEVFSSMWSKDRKAAGLPTTMWARDLRASGITEGRASGVSTDDAAKVAGHASTKTTSAVYDRAALEAAERFADARSKKRGGE
ncbi:tyrosine-type recombinase/integrase [Rhizobium laguerreae]|uniref:tyrosine-type recombinase/integrase n=1 Tax=Rhizobium laguerreae TaxID=1076926 RepID=UPI001C91DF7C|nr:tyrosine-type recombinase/integrase [Rhizobium laguerreae]MBY3434879.1 integrase [Rhizobium laguerreae]MBY3449021.1 integrase [Rhizobium laguerreae]MBY3456795.1 integrase [Rhizobium laguerreae]